MESWFSSPTDLDVLHGCFDLTKVKTDITVVASFLVKLWEKLTSTPQPVEPILSVGQQKWWVKGIGIALAVGGIAVYFYGSNSQRLANLRNENSQLQSDFMSAKKELKDGERKSDMFFEKNNELASSNSELVDRINQLENRLMDLLEAIAANNNAAQQRLITQIYREQIQQLHSKIVTLQTKNKKLHNKMACLTCSSQEANYLLRPCGHTTCSKCYTQLKNLPSSIHGGQPNCPFCKQQIVEACQKYQI